MAAAHTQSNGAWGMRTTLAVASLVVGAFVSSCATSSFYSPDEETVYRYGNFCGPGNPVRVSEDPAVQMQQLLSFEPVDSLDMVCRMHDMCYEERGRDDPGCDYAILGAMGFMAQRAEGLGDTTQQQCANLAYEIMSPFATKYTATDSMEIATTVFNIAAALGGNDDAASSLMESDTSLDPGVEGLFSSMLLSSRAGLAGRGAGYPAEPGYCHGSNPLAIEANFICQIEFFTANAGDPSRARAMTAGANGCAEVADANFGG